MTDDSEEIFRRAAEHYPLKTDTPDFAAVLKKMEGRSDHSDETPAPGKNKKRWLFLLLLLIPFAIIEFKYDGISGLFTRSKKSQPAASSTKESTAQSTAQLPKQSGVIHNESANQDQENTSTAVAINKTPTSNGNAHEANTSPVDQAVATLKNNTTGNPATPVNIPSSKKKPAVTGRADAPSHTVTTNAKQHAGKSNTETSGTEENIHTPARKITYSTKQKSKVTITNGEATEDDVEKKMAMTDKKTSTVNEPPAERPSIDPSDANAKKDIAVNDVEKNDVETKKEDPAAKKPGEVLKPNIKETDSTKTPDKDEKKKPSKQKHFYGGLIGGPDLSTIKLQDVKKVGINFGFVVGYKINNRFSIETGLLMDKKFYSSDGKYFSTEKLSMPAYANIEYVSGDCKMLELPINLYYNFSRKTKSNWFVSTGISSYFMSSETYTFDVNRYGTTYPYTADYKTHDNQFAAVINFSAGYTHKLGRICDLRIEPYLKLPVNKVGTGDLPIQSAGLMIGLTRYLF